MCSINYGRKHLRILQWRHSELDGVSPVSPLFAQPFVQAQIKENTKLRINGLCEGTPPVTCGLPLWIPLTDGQGPVPLKLFSNVITLHLRRISAETCGLDDVFPPDDLSSGPYTQSIIRFFFLYIKLMCPYFILLIYTDGERDGLWMACPFRTLVVLYRMFPFIICLILMNYLMEFYFIGFVNAHLPGCFCPWTFRLNIGLNTSPSDSFVSYLNSHLGYSAGEFQALQLIVLAVFGAVD